MATKPSAEILRKFVANECDEAERELVNQWYHSLDYQLGSSMTKAEENLLFEKIQSQIKEEESETAVYLPKLSFWKYAVRIAAAVIFCFAVFFWVKRDKETTSSTSSLAGSKWITFKNDQTRIVRHCLPDSSVVWLQPKAEISYPETFSKRETRFAGEGFFEVTPDKNHPFEILTGGLKTRVLGTSFNVRANNREATCRISVVTGSVEVTSVTEGRSVTLMPSQQIVFEKKKHVMVVETMKKQESNKEIWQAVSLVFKDVPMGDVADKIEKMFAVKVEFKNKTIKQCRLTVDFDNQKLPEILEMIETLLGTTYMLEDNRLVLDGEGCD